MSDIEACGGYPMGIKLREAQTNAANRSRYVEAQQVSS
jgi:hypothetical protein